MTTTADQALINENQEDTPIFTSEESDKISRYIKLNENDAVWLRHLYRELANGANRIPIEINPSPEDVVNLTPTQAGFICAQLWDLFHYAPGQSRVNRVTTG